MPLAQRSRTSTACVSSSSSSFMNPSRAILSSNRRFVRRPRPACVEAELVAKAMKAKRVALAVCQGLDIEYHKLASIARDDGVLRARALVAYVCRDHFGLSYPSIADGTCRSTHTAIIYNYKCALRRMADDELMRQAYSHVCRVLGETPRAHHAGDDRDVV
jgi:hypothetical protein